jgi:hypothetical protein
VLTLALLVDLRYFAPLRKDQALDMKFFEVGVGVVVLVGEVTALSTLHAREDPSELESTVVLAAIGFPLLLIGMRMLRTRMQALGERAPG